MKVIIGIIPNTAKPLELFGNQRVVIQVSQDVKANVQALLPWRRRDNFSEQKDIAIVAAETSTVVDHKHILEINNEFGHLIFKPNNQSDLYHMHFTDSCYSKLIYNKSPENSKNP